MQAGLMNRPMKIEDIANLAETGALKKRGAYEKKTEMHLIFRIS